MSYLEPSQIKHWQWNGIMQGDIALPIDEDYDQCVFIDKDSESILFRTIKRKGQAAEAPKHVSNEKNYVNDKDTSIFPAPIHKMTLQQLIETLKKLGLKTTGSKSELQSRLKSYLSK